MIILLSGKPGVGKSTLVRSLVDSYTRPILWTITDEMRDIEGNRVGFKALNSDGQAKVISHKSGVISDVTIGQNRVDLDAVNLMFGSALDETKIFDGLVVIDEIGPIQLLSGSFAKTLDVVFQDSTNVSLIATIHYSDERLEQYRDSKSAWHFIVTEENRDLLAKTILLCANNFEIINDLPQQQRDYLHEMLDTYIGESKVTQIGKLLNNAIHYVVDSAVNVESHHSWSVQGNHGNYSVNKHNDDFVCTCDLFNGKGQYVHNAGECSHIQAVRLFSIA